MFELKESDLPELERLDELGYRWVARDEDGGVYAYDSVPTRGSISWTGRGCYRQIGLGRDSKIGVSWSDPEPLNIAAAIAQINAGMKPNGCEWCSSGIFESVGVHYMLEKPAVFLAGGNYKPKKEERFKLCPMCGTPLTSPCEGGEKE